MAAHTTNHKYASDGWSYISMEDTLDGDYSYDADEPESYPSVCAYCGNPIRYQHWIEHPLHGVIGVGCVCADRLTGTNEAKDGEKSARKLNARLRTLINSKRWEKCRNGSFITFEGYKLKIWENKDKISGDLWYKLQILYELQGEGPCTLDSKRRYNKFNDAVKQAFKCITDGSLKSYILKHKDWGNVQFLQTSIYD